MLTHLVVIFQGGVIRAFNACLKHMAVHKGGKGGVFVATASMAGKDR